VPRFGDPEPLGPEHVVEGFDCGTPSLNTWLTRHARQAAPAGSGRVFVIEDADQARVVGYYALAAGSVAHAHAIPRARKGMPGHPIPAALLARLAVDRSVQGRGLGAWLLRDAMLRTLTAAESIGIRLMLVHAIDDTARAFYARHGFAASPTDPLTLQFLVKDMRKTVEAGS
jgi:GNAT superfamily N-acetyltransferase